MKTYQSKRFDGKRPRAHEMADDSPSKNGFYLRDSTVSSVDSKFPYKKTGTHGEYDLHRVSGI